MGRRAKQLAALALALVAVATLPAGLGRGTAATTCALESAGCPPWPPVELMPTVAEVEPRLLPRRELVAVRFRGGGRVATTASGASFHPAALREAALHVDRHVDFDVSGLPRCGYRRIARLRPEGARPVCRRAIVGTGRARFELAYPGSKPISPETETTLFNGGRRDGAIRLLLHGHIEVPVPRALIARVELRPAPSGDGGWTATVEIPRTGDGYGSLTEFVLGVGREFRDEDGEPHSFVSARCPDGIFELGVPRAVFKNEAGASGVPPQTIVKFGLALPCKRKP